MGRSCQGGDLVVLISSPSSAQPRQPLRLGYAAGAGPAYHAADVLGNVGGGEQHLTQVPAVGLLVGQADAGQLQSWRAAGVSCVRPRSRLERVLDSDRSPGSSRGLHVRPQLTTHVAQVALKHHKPFDTRPRVAQLSAAQAKYGQLEGGSGPGTVSTPRSRIAWWDAGHPTVRTILPHPLADGPSALIGGQDTLARGGQGLGRGAQLLGVLVRKGVAQGGHGCQ